MKFSRVLGGVGVALGVVVANKAIRPENYERNEAERKAKEAAKAAKAASAAASAKPAA